MAFSLGEDDNQGMTEMNLIPLIDIMLVLMIIFLVTATVANPSIPLTLPQTTAEIQPPPPKEFSISISADNQVAVNGTVVSMDQLTQQLQQAAQSPEKPAIQLRADKEAKYDTVAQVMGHATEAGLSNIAFVTDN
ncbi:biopolymer transporter ExbD [Acinetobacter qingfengensis]|uniref:Biopolymer transporter ExbD n=1 Tax=Acinetobacter qingfengensis TaxID=1262585 RepID=A0A1E7RG27_9GAMM|nr:biopolymer transporter ExbD [Acinetobacter qingfengensis]KAA8732772.1 biopolymer transporter ExbD [Acinetobacter qingfengensis]OEY98115.1 biopolymer transporter ExbD [Acinetobacter qingfengensis]